ncbi:MAG: DUF5678 domain-containing protein [Candidatus Bathyarchaeia archaeon]
MVARIADDMRWIRENARELQSNYPDMYIAVYNGKVVAADKDLKRVYEIARPYSEKAIIKYVFSEDLFVL